MVRSRSFTLSLFSLILFSLILCWPCAAETVLLDFSSPSCGPCQQMRPIVHRLQSTGLQVQEVNIMRQSQLAASYQVSQVPTFVVLVDGREAARLVGATSYEQLQQMVTKVSPPAVAPIAQAGSALPAVDLTEPQPGRILEIQQPQPQTRQPASPRGSQALQQNLLQRRLIEATVKISIEDPDGRSAGTGTIVDARSGEALVQTCGHLFRSSGGKGAITVTLFRAGPSGAEVRDTLPGNLIHYDLERDLALVSIRPNVPVQQVSVARDAKSIVSGATVTTVGCNQGQNPTAISTRITAVDRYQGHPNVEAAGAPIEGRSGGGLFNINGELIGVCYAADPQNNEGLYASLPSIHAQLDSLKLAMIYQSSSPSNTTVGQPPRNPVSQASFGEQQVAAIPQEDFERGQYDDNEQAPPNIAMQPPVELTTSSLSPAEIAALEEIQRRGANSEVICIIRPKSPGGKSDVITLSNVSPAFVQALTQPK